MRKSAVKITALDEGYIVADMMKGKEYAVDSFSDVLAMVEVILHPSTAESDEFFVGQKVHTKNHGNGTVLSTDFDGGDGATIEVEFPDHDPSGIFKTTFFEDGRYTPHSTDKNSIYYLQHGWKQD